MAYEKQTWECGDILTPEAMNHIEQGIKDVSDAQEQGGGGNTFKTKSVHPTESITVPANTFAYAMFPLSELEGKTILGIRAVNGATLPMAEHIITSLGTDGYRYQVMFRNFLSTSVTMDKADISIEVVYVE